MKKIEGVVVYYDDGSRERLSAQQIMERFFAGFGGFVNNPSQNTSGVSQVSEPRLVEPEKNVQTTQERVANVDLPTQQRQQIVSNEPEPEKTHPEKTITGLPAPKKFTLTDNDKEYRAASITKFPFGTSELKGKSLLECIMWDRAFMVKVAKNTRGRNADLAHKINLVLSRNPPREDD